MGCGRIPVTVVTGYLGAGKTSLLNHLLRGTERRFAIIVNEYGDVGIDGDLIDSGAEDLIELSSGCVCCVVRGDLIRTMRDLLRRDRGFDGILIETTGLANPAPVIQTFIADQQLAAQCRLDAVVTVVDALHAAGHLDASRDAADQIALASVILLNKASEAPDPAATEARLRALNPMAPIHRIDRGRADPGLWMDTGDFDLGRIESLPPGGADTHGHIAQDDIAALCLSAEARFDPAVLEAWLGRLLAVRGADILRTKGIIDTGVPEMLAVQAVHMLLEGEFTRPWPDGPRQSRLVFIGRNLERKALREGFLACRVSETVQGS